MLVNTCMYRKQNAMHGLHQRTLHGEHEMHKSELHRRATHFCDSPHYYYYARTGMKYVLWSSCLQNSRTSNQNRRQKLHYADSLTRNTNARLQPERKTLFMKDSENKAHQQYGVLQRKYAYAPVRKATPVSQQCELKVKAFKVSAHRHQRNIHNCKCHRVVVNTIHQCFSLQMNVIYEALARPSCHATHSHTNPTTTAAPL